MIKRLLIAIVLLVIVVGGIVGFNMFRDNAIDQFFADMPVAPTTVSTVEVEPATWTQGIQAIGTVGASRGVDLSVEIAGVVEEINFEANEKVEKGDLLVQLDDTQQAADLAGGVELARETLETGDALRRLEALAELSGKLAA